MDVITKKWFDYAKADLEAAEILMKHPKSSWSYQLAVLHCHQAIEKLLKTVIVSKGKEVYKIHDIVKLAETSKLELPPESQEYLKELNVHYQPSRYPDIPFKGSVLKYNEGVAKYHFGKTKELFFMDRKKLNVRKLVSEYIKGFPSDIKIEGVFLFGSYATGKIREDSDVDLVIISPDFKHLEFMERLVLLSKLRKSKSTRSVPMDIIGYTPEEFENIDKESIIMRRAKREGKMIFRAK